MKKLFAMAALVAASVSVSAEVTPRSPIVPWGAQAEIIITNDLTEKYSDGSWHLTADAQQWIEYSYDGTTEGGTIQQTNRNNVWFDFYDEATDTMIVTSEEKNWGGYLSVFNKAGSKDGLMVVGKNRYPAFFVTGTDKAKFYFSGSAGTAGYPQIEVYEVGSETPVAIYTGDIALTKSTWDKSTLLIADGLDKAKSYKIVARTMALNAETNEYTYEGGDVVLQVVKFYGDQAPMREDGLIISGSEIGSYINQHLAAYPEVTDFTFEGNGKYTIAESIIFSDGFTISGVANAPATIDVSALSAPFIKMNDTPVIEAVESGQFVITKPTKIENIKVTGLTKNFFADGGKGYAFVNFTINNVVAQYDTQSGVVLNFAASMAINFNITNSTFYSNEPGTGNFIALSGKRPWLITGFEEETGKLIVANNTFFNVAKSKQFLNTNTLKGQKYLYEVNSNIFVDVSNKKIYGNMTNNANQLTTDGKNTYLWDGEFFSEPNYNGDEGLQSDPGFKNAAAGDFTVAANSLQAKFRTGDPRWLVPYATDAIKIEVDLAENTDWVRAINDALAISEAPSSITVQFFEAGEYPTTAELNTNSPITIQNGSDINAGEATIVINHAMTLGGAIKIDGVNIDASNATTPIITLASNDYKLLDNGFYDLGSIQFKNMSVKGLTQPLVKGNGSKNKISEVLVENCVIELGEIGNKVPFDFSGGNGGAVGAFNIKKSTIWAATPTTSSLFSTQSGNKAIEAGFTVQNFAIDNSTLYNVAKSKNFYTHRQNSQTWLAYYLRNSIIINCGKSGQFVKSMNGGGSSKNPKWTVSGNAFFFGDEELADQSANESTGDNDEPVENSVVTTAAIFAGLAEGNFDGTLNLSYDSYIPSAVGDPRWSLDIKPMVEFDMTALVGVSQADWNGAGTAGAWAAPFAVTADGRTAAMVENYNGATGEATGEYFTQTLTDLPNGTYVVTLYANAMSTGQRDAAVLTDMEDGATDVCYVYANDSQVWMTAHLATTTSQNDEYTIITTVTDGTLKMGLVKVKAGTNWHTINIKSLSRYVPMDEAWELAYNDVADKKMSNAAKAKLDAAYGAEKTYANYQELVKVILEAQKSINSYAMIAAGVIPTDRLNGWAISTPQGELACNTWSTEGNTDESGMTTPFIQDWVGAGNQLGAGNLYYTLEGVNPGETYEVSALVRVFNEAAGDRTGASFFVGDANIDIAENGTACGGNFTEKGIYGTFTLQGTVDGEGKLQFGIAIAAESMLNWVAIKNVTITEVASVIPEGEVLYALVEGDAFTSGQVVEVKDADGNVVATIQYGEAGEWDGEDNHAYAPFKAAAADNHCADWGYTAFTAGNGVNGNKAGGTWYTITPNYSGIIAAAVQLNADKKFHLVVDGEQNPVFDNNTVSEKYYGPIEFNVIGGKAYKFYCDGSKLGFYGFNYQYGPDVEPIVETDVASQAVTVGVQGIPTATATNGVIYNLNGQQVQNPVRGLYIVNGRKVVVK